MYSFVRLCTPVVFGVFAGFYISFSKYAALPFGSKVLIVAIAAGIGYLAPSIYIRNVATKRKKKLRNQLPDALDLLVICAEAGLSLDSAVNRSWCGKCSRRRPRSPRNSACSRSS